MKKTEITLDKILKEYSNYVLEHLEKPKSVYQFAKQLKIEEAQFYEFFSSFEAIEKQYFKILFQKTIEVVVKTEEFESYDAKTKLLSLYYTFFGNLTQNRSLVLYLLENEKNLINISKKLYILKEDFVSYFKTLDIQPLDFKNETANRYQNEAVSSIAWTHFLATVNFWLQDTSSSFEKTDIFIEKSVATSFDLLEITPLKNILDFGKFLWKEKVHFQN
ncbi:MAG: TetR family transcriptional regulator C-terminal domain-containing protein [Flavobacterium sp.]|jgi:hypothetical protein